MRVVFSIPLYGILLSTVLYTTKVEVFNYHFQYFMLPLLANRLFNGVYHVCIVVTALAKKMMKLDDVHIYNNIE
ncbi:MAG: hypothetical protein EXX96DRAFT_578619 [Benjaminiella poitrasii]|nr:MAG: hypothetical protein EXX96DRAFT_578619 [Benjaminiella poitrasii]